MLRPYQTAAIRTATDLLRDHRAVLICAPTGSGKTVIAIEGFIRPFAARGARVLFVVHLREVIDQTAARLDAAHVAHGIVMAGRPAEPEHRVQLASVQTLATGKRDVGEIDLIIIDEAHRSAAPTYARLAAAHPRAKVVGLTATPIRADGKSLCPPTAPYTALVTAVSPETLVAEGHLVPIRAYGGDVPDVSHVRIDPKSRDYDAAQLSATYMATPKLLANPVEQWKAHANGLRTVVFACSRAHGQALALQYQSAGVAAEYVDGETKQAEREGALERLRAGKTLVLINVDVYTEGWDEPLLGCVQVVRATQSLGRWIQMAGRGLRPVPSDLAAKFRVRKPHVVLLDHGENLQRHGSPLETRAWSLRAEKERTDGLTTGRASGAFWHCDRCGRMGSPPRPQRCPECSEPLGGPGLPLVAKGRLRVIRNLRQLRVRVGPAVEIVR